MCFCAVTVLVMGKNSNPAVLVVRTPEEYLGYVISYFAERGHVLDLGATDRHRVLRVKVPVLDVSFYESDLSEMTGGRGLLEFVPE